MSPEELAAIHPRIYHITRPHVLPSILKHGLLPTSDLLTLFEIQPVERALLETRRRQRSVVIVHSEHGEATLTDNAPLSEIALSKCLDDGLEPRDWMLLLNQRVFFWVDERNLDNHLSASKKDGEERVVLTFDTFSLLRACFHNVELAAINTGSTIRKPARRGLSTFAPAHLYAYADWRRLRGGHDRIKELTVKGKVRDVAALLLAKDVR